MFYTDVHTFLLLELSVGNWIGIGFLVLLFLFVMSFPVVAVIRMNTTQHVHRQKLKSDYDKLNWCEEQIMNGNNSRNTIRQNQAVMNTKLDFIIANTPVLSDNNKTGMFSAIDAEPEEQQPPPLEDPNREIDR